MLQLLCDSMRPFHELSVDEATEVGLSIPLASWDYYKRLDEHSIAASMSAAKSWGPTVVDLRFQTETGGEPPYTWVPPGIQKQDKASWDFVHGEWVRRLRKLVAHGYEVYMSSWIVDERFLDSRRPLDITYIGRGDPRLPLVVELDECTLSRAEGSGRRGTLWPFLWYYGSVGYVIEPKDSSTFRSVSQRTTIDEESAAEFFNAIHVMFLLKHELEGVWAISSRLTGPQIVEVFEAKQHDPHGRP